MGPAGTEAEVNAVELMTDSQVSHTQTGEHAHTHAEKKVFLILNS